MIMIQTADSEAIIEHVERNEQASMAKGFLKLLYFHMPALARSL